MGNGIVPPILILPWIGKVLKGFKIATHTHTSASDAATAIDVAQDFRRNIVIRLANLDMGVATHAARSEVGVSWGYWSRSFVFRIRVDITFIALAATKHEAIMT